MKMFKILLIMCCFTFSLSAYGETLLDNENTGVFDFESANKNLKTLEKQIDKQKNIINVTKKELHKLQKQFTRQKKEIKNAKKIIRKAQSISIEY